MASYNFQPLQDIMDTWTVVNTTTSVPKVEPSTITCIAGGVEMLRVAQDGFYVRGVKVPADDKEAETVYNAFKAFLMWAELNKQ